MAEPYRGILGPVLGQVEAIKSARSNRAMDELQAKYLGERIQTEQAGRQQESQAATQQAALQKFANGLIAVRESPNQLEAAPRILSDPGWQASAKVLGVPGEQFLDLTGMDNASIIANINENLRLAGVEVEKPAPVAADPYSGPGGSLLQRDPTTGLVKEVLGRAPQPAERAAPTAFRQATAAEKQAAGYPAAMPVQVDQTGRMYPSEIGMPEGVKAPSEADKLNSVKFESMINAEKDVATLMKGAGPTSGSMWNAFLGAAQMPAMQSDQYKRYMAAAERWTANQIYLKSGATAPPEEVRSAARQYFPQPGEGSDVTKQKATARQQELDAVRRIIHPQFGGQLGIGAGGLGGGGPPPTGGASGGWTIEVVED